MGLAAVGIGQPEGDVLAEVLERAANDYERWEGQLARANHCAKPVRLSGRVTEVDRTTGELRETFNTEREPDKTLLIACNDRRESRCPSCAARYKADSFQLVAAGLRGGKGVPETVAEHPMLFVTFTAPSFGAVHAHRSTGGVVHACRPRRAGKCVHGIPLSCWKRHDQDDESIGRPLCPKCFDYEGQVLWNALAPELWRRTTIYVRRTLARVVGMTLRDLEKVVRLSYVKVAEYQRRGAVHFHAVLRLDGKCPEPEHVPPPPANFTVEVLEDAIRAAADWVSAPVPEMDGDDSITVVARWGEQLHVRPITGASSLSPRAVAAYVAKYATKCSDDLGLGNVGEVESRADTSGHLVGLVRAAQRLGGQRNLRGLRLQEHAFNLGFRGHWSTKSRRYSTTFTALRRARSDFVKRQRCSKRIALDQDVEPQENVETLPEWRYIGCGYRTAGEAWLAMSAAARAREHRRLAREDASIKH
ncbi:MAG: replication initiator [Actinomycetota bacterium]